MTFRLYVPGAQNVTSMDVLFMHALGSLRVHKLSGSCPLETLHAPRREAYFFAGGNASNPYAVVYERANPPRGGGAMSTGLFRKRWPGCRKED
jgi:hypothetical protein